MYLPEFLEHVRRDAQPLCPMNHPGCGPGPTIGISADPPTTNTSGGGVKDNIVGRSLALTVGSERNVVGIVLAVVSMMIGLAIYAFFGRRLARGRRGSDESISEEPKLDQPSRSMGRTNPDGDSRYHADGNTLQFDDGLKLVRTLTREPIPSL
ncbi:hypothetical protein WOLCODRAFT_147689 [Wolfiporia cocos MD-104 SS10]|uniref:Uncharacterized protein n=1 Tax=Wolfiporia cocos (strain MD-104) TaxID=742152 RepID=A0A2H3IUE3_WOLCO|nr:hypothetical protein WOLCODRAFT_147689 [Wolfiporia cocos MD-104 SS10]